MEFVIQDRGSFWSRLDIKVFWIIYILNSKILELSIIFLEVFFVFFAFEIKSSKIEVLFGPVSTFEYFGSYIY